MKKIITIIHGFCMALADSVPGVSGGTVAFLMGFYDNFITSLNDLISGTSEKRKEALFYLIKLGIGWIIGFLLAAVVLSSIFETHIYQVSSLFMGFIIFAIPIVVYEERHNLRSHWKSAFFMIIGIAVVAAITYFNPVGSQSGINTDNLSVVTLLYIFVAGAIAICAMILPGISGSSLLLIFGIYLPIITGIKDILHMNFHALPILLAFGFGVITGIILIIKAVKNTLEKHRAAMIYLVTGLMIGSLYAVSMGPTTLDIPQEQMTLSSFHIIFFLIGGAIITAMQISKKIHEKGNAN